MALKDWKKTLQNKNEIRFTNIRTNSYLIINYMGFSRDLNKNVYSVQIPGVYGLSGSSYNKLDYSKSQALSFAKSYMRSH